MDERSFGNRYPGGLKDYDRLSLAQLIAVPPLFKIFTATIVAVAFANPKRRLGTRIFFEVFVPLFLR